MSHILVCESVFPNVGGGLGPPQAGIGSGAGKRQYDDENVCSVVPARLGLKALAKARLQRAQACRY